MKRIIVIALIAGIIVSGGGWYWYSNASSGTAYRFEEVTRGKLVATVSATGTLQPREVVDVGAQVLGQITYLGKDPNTQSKYVDWGSEVQGPVLDKDGKIIKPGTLLAQIDPALYEAQRNAARASLASAQAALKGSQASLKSAQADVLIKTATLSQATSDWGRAQKLFPTGVSQAEYDQFKAVFQSATANLEVSKANVETAEANINTAQAQIAVAEANLRTAQTNLDYSTISAPVTGIVIDRRVNLGQTVVASLSAPSLFLIAKDLTQMEVWATMNEVDIGRIRSGKPVDFTVDSNPGRVYHGVVVPQGKLPLRLNATMNSNVVTYTVVVSADNSDLALRPYQTTNLSFIVEDKENALLVPNSALRWQPSKDQIAPEMRAPYFQIKNKKRSPTDSDSQDRGLIWTQGDDGYVRYLEVRTGLGDGAKTEVVSVEGGGTLPEHTRVVVGEEKKGGGSGGSNPFSVKMFSSNKAKE
jgi:HlyD family secretion protein